MFSLPTPNIFIIVIYYFAIYNLYKLKCLNKKINRYKFIRNIKILKIDIKIILTKTNLKLIRKVVMTSSVLTIIIYYLFIIYFENYIWYFNVQQGNMAIVKYKDTTILFDFGSTTKNLAANVISNFLKAKNIHKIDYAVISHFHEDHVNAYEFLIKNNLIGSFIYTIPNEDNVNIYEDFERSVNSYGISSVIVKNLDKIKIGNINIDILSPPYDCIINSKDILNSNSIISLLSIKNKNFMFMGDASVESEKYLIKNNIFKDEYIKEKLQNIEVFQVGHHGSITSTSDEFLNNIKANIGLISAKKEKYGHPHEDILKKLNIFNIKTHITENKGALKVKL